MDFTKLPKWAQEHIKTIERERDTAIEVLNQYLDVQTPSPFYFEEHPCTGEDAGGTPKRRYIQTHRIELEFEGITLSVFARGMVFKDDKDIQIQWSTANRSVGEIAMIPESFQTVRLVAKKNMRD